MSFASPSLIDDALEFVVDHNDRRSYGSKAEIVNPARQIRHCRDGVGRLRFLTREEYDRL
jgi:hypothetical protein